MEVLGPGGIRSLPVFDLYRLPGETPQWEFTLQYGEIITAILVPRTSAGRHSTYHKVRDRESYAFALASAAVALQMDGEYVTQARIALGGVATKPWRATVAENLLTGQRVTPETTLAVGRAAFTGARAGHQNGYKIELGARTVADAIKIAAERDEA